MTRTLDILRLLLGAVLVLSAIVYFMPFLVPFVELPQFGDTMAQRLRSAFDKSGLLAVAKFIHIAGGALLLIDRKVPFALAAMMPVNVCASFMALIEGQPGLALLAVLILAANALLCLAYLPYYRAMLSPGRLADGEGPEPGRNFESLFVNPLSNAPTAAYLRGALVLLAALAFYWFVVPGLNGPTGLATLAIPAVLLAIGWVRALMQKGT
jgi:hypothetical protein